MIPWAAGAGAGLHTEIAKPAAVEAVGIAVEAADTAGLAADIARLKNRTVRQGN